MSEKTRFNIEISKYELESAVGIDLDEHDCERIVDHLSDRMGSYAMEELILDAAREAGIVEGDDDDFDREDNPTNLKNSRRVMHRAGQGMTGYVGGSGEPVYGVYDVEARSSGGFAAYLKERHRDVPMTLLPFVFTARSKPKISARLDELTEQARAAVGGGRSDNPSHSGVSLGSVALGAAVGAAAMHFTMKPKP